MSIVLDGTSGITTPEITSAGGPLVVNVSAPDSSLVVDASGNVGIGTSSPSAPLAVGRVNTAEEGGQIDLCRASDNASAWGIDAFGSTSTPSLRFVDNVASATRASIDSSGNFAFNSGYGSSATAYGCRAWVNFNGTGTVAIRASGNVSSITDGGTGQYTVNFTTAMPDTNYCLLGVSEPVTGGANYTVFGASTSTPFARTTSSIGLRTGYVSSTVANSLPIDADVINIAIVR